MALWIRTVGWALPQPHLLIEAGRGHKQLSKAAIRGVWMDLGTVDVTWVHQGPAHEELAIILRVVQIVTDLFVFLMKLPNFSASVAGGRD